MAGERAPDAIRSSSNSATAPARKIGAGVLAAYGFGAVAYGVKDTAFGTFLLLFYNQVLGLPAATVGLIIMSALVIDAFIDPIIGVLSDRTHTRWGRRHPWMYASALPVLIAWLLLWNPPARSPGAMLVWLFVTTVAVRSAVSCYEVPSLALAPELSADYDERSRILAWRTVFGWLGGIVTMIAAYAFFLAPAAGYPNGLLNPAGYGRFALAGAVLMVVTILVSAAGTHREIARLPRGGGRPAGFAETFRELAETVRNRAFGVLMLAGLLVYSSLGISYALSNYLYTFVWGFGVAALSALPLVLLVSVLIAAVLAPRLGRRFGKKRGAMWGLLLAAPIYTAPYWLRHFGLFPGPGDALEAPVFLAILLVSNALNSGAAILALSMMADVVEDSEMKTGRRSEGVFFSGAFLLQKCTSGLGIFVAGVLLSLAGFPEHATPGGVPEPTLDRLSLIFAGVFLALAWAAALVYSRFPFGRTEHEERLLQLAQRRGQSEPSVSSVGERTSGIHVAPSDEGATASS